MSKLAVRGVIPPMITPFTKAGDVDEKALREVVNFEVEHNEGLFPLGTYGGGPLMGLTERKRVAEVILDEVNGRIPVIVHVGACSTMDTVDLARHAEKSGAAAVAAIVAYYYGWSQEHLFVHYKTLIDSVDIPVYVYNNPACGRNSVAADTLRRLAEHGLNGVKDSSFDIGSMYEYQKYVKTPDFDFIIGTEALIAPAFMNGVRGVVSGVSIAFPEVVHEAVAACEEKNWELAMEKQMLVRSVRDVMHMAPSITAIHAFLKMRGINAGFPRAPFQLLEEEIFNAMKQRLIALGVL